MTVLPLHADPRRQNTLPTYDAKGLASEAKSNHGAPLSLPKGHPKLSPAPINLGSIDFTPNGTQPGLAFGIQPPESCSNCHRGSGNEQALLPTTPWEGSMMANAARDPLFWAALDVANRDVPGIGDYCLRCHAPNAWLQGRVRKDGFGGTVAGTNGCLLQGDQDDLDDKVNDYQGIGCEFCHRVKANGPTGQAPPIINANIWFDDQPCVNGNGSGPCRTGPYRYPSATPVGNVNVPHTWDQSTFYRSSEYCAACHNVSSPDTNSGPLKTLILANGTDTGLAFPLDRTFVEWRKSDFGDRLLTSGMEDRGFTAPEGAPTCQSCHMPISADPAAKACTLVPDGARKGDLAVHSFAGANYWMMDVLKATYGGPSQLNREFAYDQSKATIVRNLQQNSARIQVALDPLAVGTTNLSARVRVTNLTGHKLPTGYAEGRRMWLQVRALDANNQQIFISGAYNVSTGVLTNDPQLKVYETLHGVWQRFGQTNTCVLQEPGTNRKLFNLALSNCIAKDNRIPPLNFTGGNDVEVQPVGYVYPETAPGSGKLVNFDITQYNIPVSASAPRPIRVEAVLNYQVTTKEYIEFLRDEAVNSAIPSENAMCNRSSDTGPANKLRGQFMFDLWTQNNRAAPLAMVSAQATSTSASAGAK